MTYRKRIFEQYHELHGRYLDGEDELKLKWFKAYAEKNYLPLLKGRITTESRILEIGCNKGYLLEAFSDGGYRDIYGIDLCEQDLQHAKTICPGADVICESAEDYLPKHENHFDLILIKAVLEHIEKNNVYQLLTLCNNALTKSGLILIDVPNMDWLFASHERYMDFTHENGFTSESLAQVMRSIFSKNIVVPAESVYMDSKFRSMLRIAMRAFIKTCFKIAEPDVSELPLFSRSIIACGTKTNLDNAHDSRINL